MKTFIHHDGALGDVLLSLPAIGLIKRDSGFIHLAARADTADLLKKAGWVDRISPAGSSLFLSLHTGNPDARAVNFLSEFGRAFVFTALEDSPFAGNIKRVVPDTKTVLTIPPGGTGKHVAGFRLAQLQAGSNNQCTQEATGSCRGKAHCPGNPLLEFPPVYRKRAEQALSNAGYDNPSVPLIAMHPGSGGTRKRWPIEHFFELAERMEKDSNPFFIILSGPAENSILGQRIDEFAGSHQRVAHVRNEELVTVSALLSMCSLYIGNDSGITHLASSVGGKVIALFGPTDPLLWKPCGHTAHVVASGMECAPCEQGMPGSSASGGVPECNQECLAGITVEKVLEKLLL